MELEMQSLCATIEDQKNIIANQLGQLEQASCTLRAMAERSSHEARRADSLAATGSTKDCCIRDFRVSPQASCSPLRIDAPTWTDTAETNASEDARQSTTDEDRGLCGEIIALQKDRAMLSSEREVLAGKVQLLEDHVASLMSMARNAEEERMLAHQLLHSAAHRVGLALHELYGGDVPSGDADLSSLIGRWKECSLEVKI
jgi:hypothetical protein